MLFHTRAVYNINIVIVIRVSVSLDFVNFAVLFEELDNYYNYYFHLSNN